MSWIWRRHFLDSGLLYERTVPDKSRGNAETDESPEFHYTPGWRAN